MALFSDTNQMLASFLKRLSYFLGAELNGAVGSILLTIFMCVPLCCCCGLGCCKAIWEAMVTNCKFCEKAIKNEEYEEHRQNCFTENLIEEDEDDEASDDSSSCSSSSGS